MIQRQFIENIQRLSLGPYELLLFLGDNRCTRLFNDRPMRHVYEVPPSDERREEQQLGIVSIFNLYLRHPLIMPL